jgi:polyhydroxyalkanoate synthesis regulator phasin
MSDDLVYRLRKRAEIRRNITTRKSVQNNEPDRISDLLEEAAKEIEELRYKVLDLKKRLKALYHVDDRQVNEQQDRGDR